MTILRKMNTNFSVIIIAWLLLAVVVFGPIFVCGDDEVMDKPMRPKAFMNVDELREYLDLVKDFFNVNGKSRYGKRAANSRKFKDSPKQTTHRLRFKLRPEILNYISRGIQMD